MQNDVFGLDDVTALAGSIKGVHVDWCGIWTKEGCKEGCKEFRSDDVENIRQAIEEIPKVFFKTRGQQQRMSSYSGKHVLEQYRATHGDDNTKYRYISNGCFIIAMMYKGYVPKLKRMMKKNCYCPNVWLNSREQEGRRILPDASSCKGGT